MTDNLESLNRKINGARELESVVHTMKALAASSIGQYERAMLSLGDYYRTVELGLAAYFHRADSPPVEGQKQAQEVVNAVVFGSDQGLVGQFNEVLGDYVLGELAKIPGKKRLWVVGERINYHLLNAGYQVKGLMQVPNSVAAITPLVGQILLATEGNLKSGEAVRLLIFHNRPTPQTEHQPVAIALLPFDDAWQANISQKPWPTNKIPEVISVRDATLYSLVSEYLFVSIFRACAESLASEQASRLSAMQRAEKNISELLDTLGLTFNRLRQSTIDEELFEVVSGFEALMAEKG